MNQRAGFLLPENNRDNFISSLKKFLPNQQTGIDLIISQNLESSLIFTTTVKFSLLASELIPEKKFQYVILGDFLTKKSRHFFTAYLMLFLIPKLKDIVDSLNSQFIDTPRTFGLKRNKNHLKISK